MEASTPMVSIIVPAYNAEVYIAEAIQSVLNQTFVDWELLIIDDGSKDSTADISNSFLDDRIRLIHQKNSGVSSARNRGIELSKGKYITFLDADDALPSKSLEVRVQYFETNPYIDIVHGIVSIRDERLIKESKVYKPFSYQNLLDKALKLDGRLFFNPGYMIRYSKIGSSKFQVGMTHCEDILFLITLLSKKTTYAYIAEPVYHYRVSKTSAMSNMNDLIKGYFDLLHYVVNIPYISYYDTIIMRLKIIRVLLSWHIRNKNVAGLKDVFNVFK